MIHRTLQFGVRSIGGQSLAAGLALCLVLLSGLAYAQSVPHAAHHAHHKPSTHATVLCSWMCAAGQVLDGSPVSLPAVGGQVAMLIPHMPDDPFTVTLAVSASRGPPRLSS